FYIAWLAYSKANKAECYGACIYNSKKNGDIRIIYLLALLESDMYVKIGMENKEKIIVANAPEAKEILTACVIRYCTCSMLSLASASEIAGTKAIDNAFVIKEGKNNN